MTQIIAEPCIYWHGNTQLLLEFVEKAAACSAGFFKVQLFHPNRLLNAKWKERKKFYENNFISDELLKNVKSISESYGMQLVATVNDTEAIARCNKHNVKNIKVASGQIVEPMISAITENKWKRIFVSTGMLDDEHMDNALQMITWLTDSTDELIVMHCTSLYPSEYSEVRLNRILALRDYFQDNCDRNNITIGYSDHCIDILACIMAMGIGVPYIEKHFKISGSFGNTIEVAADELEFAELCAAANQQRKIMGPISLKMCPRESESIEHYQNRYLV